MMDLRYISTEELEQELERRRSLPPKPRPLISPNFSELVRACSDYIDILEKQGETSDSQHFIFEEAMNAVYGEDVWDWINETLT